ncbi:hypothetical protein ACHQM5_029605 [Ranunculus cassubicifolius]
MASTNLLFLFLFILLSSSANSARLLGEEDLIATTCGHTLYVDLCLSSLREDPRSETADLKGLAKIALDISLVNATKMISHLTQLKSQNDTSLPFDSFFSSCMDDCIDEYQEAAGNLEDANDALEKNSLATVDSLITAAMTDSDTCEDGFGDKEEMESPLTEKNREFSNLCSNALAIATLLG